MTKSRILYAEDDETIAFLIQDSLENYYEIEHFSDGKSAFEAFKTKDFDICLLDIMMPEMDGYEVLQRLKENPKTNHIPVIIMSALSDMQSVVKGYQLGAVEYVTKPFVNRNQKYSENGNPTIVIMGTRMQ